MYNEASSTLFEVDGTRYVYAAQPRDAFGTPLTGLLQFVEDPNGNRITLNYTTTSSSTGSGVSFTGWTDTLGRVIPVPPIGSMYRDPVYISPQRSSQYGSCPGDNNPIIWMPPGGSNPFLFCYTSVHIQSYLFAGRGFPDVPASPDPRIGNKYEAYADLHLLASIIRPDQSSWNFNYTPLAGYDGVHNYGELTQVTLPTGGTIGYTWSESYVSDCFDSYKGRQTRSMVLTRTMDAKDQLGPQRWTYSIGSTVDPQRNRTVHTLSPIAGCASLETQADYYDGSSTLLKTTKTQYQVLPAIDVINTNYVKNASVAGALPAVITTQLADGSTRTTTYTYPNIFQAKDYSANSPQVSFPYGQAATVTETDFGNGSAGPILRCAGTTYKAFDGSSNSVAYLSANLIALPSATSVYAGACSGTPVAQTTYGYDETTLQPSGISTQIATNIPNPGIRGNQTSIQKLSDTTGGVIQTTATYFDTGMPYQLFDAKRNPVTLTYAAAYQGAFITQRTLPATGGVQHVEGASYDFNTGQLTSSTDQNGQTKTYTYDPLGRLWTEHLPDAGVSNGALSKAYCYPDVNTVTEVVAQTGPLSGTYDWHTCPSINGNAARSTIHKSDALGRETSTLVSEGAGKSISVATTYDSLGRVSSVSNPYRSTADATFDLTLYAYDALGRKLLARHQTDGTSMAWTYSGPSITFADESSRSWKRTTDGLGRLTQVIEPGSLETDYTYDALNDLTSVVQHGAGTEVGRMRAFTYDPLSRLVTSANPETGTICYGLLLSGSCSHGYDVNGNLVAKTDAHGTVATYTYDALDRLTSKRYSDGTMTAAFGYDGFAEDGTTRLAGTTNAIGRLSHDTSQVNAASTYSYDPMGRPTMVTSCLPSDCSYSIAQYAAYDLAGNMTSLTYPDGRTVTQSFDGAGRLATVKGGTAQTPGAPYVSSISYFPNGSPQITQYGNGVQETFSQNSRQQLCENLATNSMATIIDRRYFFGSNNTDGQQCNPVAGNNGNIMFIADALSPSSSQAFTYDPLNRIKTWDSSSFAGKVQHQTFDYDSFGNLNQTNAYAPQPVGTPDPLTFPSAYNAASWPYDGNNRLLPSNFRCLPYGVSGTPGQVPTYDEAGRVLCSGQQNYDAKAYGWDAEGRLAQLWAQQNNNTYFLASKYIYNAEGDRVRADQITPGTSNSQSFREYTYFGGSMFAEKDQAGAWTDYVYANGKKIARVESQRPLLHLHGVRDSNTLACGVEGVILGVPASVIGYTVQTGDRLTMQMKQTLPSYGGIALTFTTPGTSGDYGSGALTDISTGTQLWANGSSDGAWHAFTGDLTPFAGQTINTVLAGIHNGTPVGTFDVWFSDVAILTVDGRTLTILNGQVTSVGGNFPNEPCGGTQLSATTDQTSTSGVGDAAATHYYLTDHLGTTQLELSSTGWPVWRGEFAPFGQELEVPSSNMRYKLTGKERDTESGLDYFGARYYGSNMGRFMSPDWSDAPVPVPFATLSNPQTLNLYSYVGNNPLSVTDPFGHNWFTNFLNGVANATYRPLVTAVEHPIITGRAVGNAVAHPIATAHALRNGVVTTSQQVMTGNGTAIGTAAGTVGMLFIPGVGEAGEAAEGVADVAKVGEVADAADAGASAAGVNTAGYGNVGGGATSAQNALTQANNYLGPGAKEIAPGVFRSADGTRQFRMTNGDITGAHGDIGPHVHFESIGSDGRTITENSHVGIH